MFLTILCPPLPDGLTSLVQSATSIWATFKLFPPNHPLLRHFPDGHRAPLWCHPSFSGPGVAAQGDLLVFCPWTHMCLSRCSVHCTRTMPSNGECSHTTPQVPSRPTTNCNREERGEPLGVSISHHPPGSRAGSPGILGYLSSKDTKVLYFLKNAIVIAVA